MNLPANMTDDRDALSSRPRTRAEHALSRAAGAPLVGGNAVRLLLDAAENYAAWLDAIRSARRTVHFENYIIRPDATGRRFRDALAERAATGVRVRVLLDWFGSFSTPRRFWRPLTEAGGTVCYHNPPDFGSEQSWIWRDHRKSLVVDGTVGFVSGVCVSDAWLGNPSRGIEPWRDTGLEIRGPSVSELAGAFAEMWDLNADALPQEEIAPAPAAVTAGGMDVRIIATTPNVTALYRLDLLIASLAQRRLWLTDAYFAGTASYVQALRAAARDGVDVRLLVPGGSDLPWLRPFTTAGYRPLLEAGVRVFEWNGSMLHAKTAVADDRWARVGSTNLNLVSWLTNYELDVAVEDEGFARQMAETYERDLGHATEIVLKKRRRVRLPSGDERSRPARGSLSRATAGALRLTRSVSAVMSGQRVLERRDSILLTVVAAALIGFSVFAVFFPRFVAWLAASVAALAGLVFLFRSLRSTATRRRRRKKRPAAGPDIPESNANPPK